jgi:adenylate cyclase class 2
VLKFNESKESKDQFFYIKLINIQNKFDICTIMKIKNLEFKAKVTSLEEYENLLLKLNPINFGVDHQIDTYFESRNGRLKLREVVGKENKLIDYKRENKLGSKISEIILYEHQPNESLKSILSNQLGIKVIVNKKRKVYAIENVEFHFDTVENLGTFIEVEAIDENEERTIEELKKQCDYYYEYFKIQSEQVEKLSYSDLLLRTNKNNHLQQ